MTAPIPVTTTRRISRIRWTIGMISVRRRRSERGSPASLESLARIEAGAEGGALLERGHDDPHREERCCYDDGA